MFKLKKLPAAIKLGAGATMALALSGCLVEGDRSVTTTAPATSENTVQHITNPTGSVIGIVQDIQGNPISGAKVSVGGRTVTTGAGGTYEFSDIPVTDVVVNTTDVSTNNNDTLAVLGNTTQALVLTIVPPSGYLGATVTVTAPASVIDYGGDKECTDDSSSTATTCQVTSGVHSFVEGFVAQAGAAVLPALNATVTGTVRDSNTGEIIPSMDMSFRMTNTYTGGPLNQDDPVLSNTNANNGVSVSYAVQNITTTTDANGDFTVSGLPSKSELVPVMTGYTAGVVTNNSGLSGVSISTNEWTSDIDVGTIMFTPNAPSQDNINPFVTNVSSVTNGSPGLFNDDIDLTTDGTGIVIDFSEPLASNIDISTIENSVEVFVWDDNGANSGDGNFDVDEQASGGYATIDSIALSDDRETVTITLASNITEGQSLHVNLLGVDFTDLEGNPLSTGASVNYDTAVTGATSNGNYVRLSLTTFVEINKDATAVTLAQLDDDTTGNDLDALVVANNEVFKDVQDDDAANVIQQLNATDDDGVGASDASNRLFALHSAIGGTDATGIDGDVASVTFTPSTASGYVLAVADENGNDQTDYSDITAISGNVVQTNGSNILNGADGSVFTIAGSSDVTLNIDSVEAGWTVTIIPVDDFGYFGSPNTLTLADNVPPTTVLQDSYGLSSTDFLVTGDTFGDGGELSNGSSASGGTPILNVTAQLLDNLMADGEEADEVSETDDNLIGELIRHNTVDSANTGLPFITTAYDAQAFTVFTDTSNTARTIGFAFSEDVQPVSGTDPSHSGTAVFSGWAALNDVTQDSDGNAVNVDLMTAEVDNIFTLAADGNGASPSEVDFAGAATDGTNTATAAVNPKVVIRDAMPPFIASGTYDGDTITLVFNEDVDPKDGDQFFLGGQAITLSEFPDNGDQSLENFTYTSSTNTLVINDEAWNNNLFLATAFALPAYTGSVTTEDHGLLTFLDIEDLNGNSWNNDSAGVTAPNFALVSNIDTTQDVAATATSGDTNGSSSITIAYASEHRIDMTSFGASANDTSLTGAQVAASVTITGAGVIDAAGATSGSLSSDGRTLTITMALSTPLASGDDIDLVAVGSAWDNTQSATANTISIP